MTDILPLNDILWVTPEESKTASGLIIANHQQSIGVVTHVGPGRLFRSTDCTWSREPLTVKPGHRIAFSHNAGMERKINGVDYLVMREADVQAILPPDAEVTPGENRKGWGN